MYSAASCSTSANPQVMTSRGIGSVCPRPAAFGPSGFCAAPTARAIELFEFYSPEQREDFPRPSDIGIQHLAVYVDDLEAAAQHLRRHGVKLMSGPNPLPGPESGEGNRFIYARTPWGLTVELISYPASMAYEQHSDTRRWRPMPTDR